MLLDRRLARLRFRLAFPLDLLVHDVVQCHHSRMNATTPKRNAAGQFLPKAKADPIPEAEPPLPEKPEVRVASKPCGRM